MPAWAIALLIPLGMVFFLGLFYVLATGGSLPVTHGALFVPTPGVRVKAFLDAVPMIPGETFADLGCGDGRTLRAVHGRYGGKVKAVGFEVNPLAFVIAKLTSLGRRGVTVRYGNFWSADLKGVQVVFCYLFPDVMEKMAGKLRRELGAGARVVSCNFPLPGWRPERVVRPRSATHNDPIYLYRFPDACGAAPCAR